MRFLDKIIGKRNLEDKPVSLNDIDIRFLFNSIREGDANIVHKYLDNGLDPDIFDEDGNPALINVAGLGYVSIAEMLLEKGANPNNSGVNGFVPLHFAVVLNHIDIVRLLLDHGARVDPPNPNGYTPLYDAAAEGHVRIARLLLEHGANIAAKGVDNSMPIHAAAYHGHVEIAKLLLSLGADAFERNDQGITALTAAAVNNHTDIMRIFVNNGMSKSCNCDSDAMFGSPEVCTLCKEAAALRQDWSNESNLKKAEEIYREAVKLFPGNWATHFGLGEILSVHVDDDRITACPTVDEMLGELREACNLAPNRREPHLKLAAVYSKMDLEAAEVVFRKAIDKCDNSNGCVYPVEWQANQFWRIAISASENHKTLCLALEAFCRAILLEPQYYGGYVKPARSVASGLWKIALSVLPDGQIANHEESVIFSPDMSAEIEKAAKQARRISDLHNRSLQLCEMFRNRGNKDDLQEALNLEEVTWEISSQDPERYKIASHYATLLQMRYDLTKQQKDLQKSLDLFKTAIALIDDTNPKKPDYLENLSTAFFKLFKHDGKQENLERSIEEINRAIFLTPSKSPSMPMRLYNFGSNYITLYNITTGLDDLRKAKDALDRAVKIADTNSPSLPSIYALRGVAHRQMYLRAEEQDEALNELNLAIKDYEEAIRITPETKRFSEELAKRLNNLANALSDRFRMLSKGEDLDRSIECLGRALKLHATLARQANYANVLQYRYLARGSFEDLNLSIAIMEKVVNEKNQEPMAYPGFILTLGNGLLRRYILLRKDDDIDRAIDYFKKAIDAGNELAINVSFVAAKNWLEIAYEKKSWPEAIEAYSNATRARERILNTQILRKDKLSWLKDMQGLAAKGAYAFYMENRLQEATIAIEQGLAQLLSESLSRERLNLERLQNSGHRELYMRYQQHMDHLNKMLADECDNPSFDEDFRKIKEGFDKTIEDIRQVPDFEGFFHLPNFKDIAAAAKINPFVYLIASDESGFALIVGVHEGDAYRCGYNYRDGVCSISMPDLTNGNLNKLLGDPIDPSKTGSYLGMYNKFMRVCDNIRTGRDDQEQLATAFEQWKSALDQTAKWLWNISMSKIVKLFPEGSQITLIPVGRLSLLPFHAAWINDSNRPIGRRYALDDLIISYAPNAQSLVAASCLANQLNTERCLGIDEPDMNDPLPSSQREVTTICSLFDQSKILRQSEATREAILRELSNYDVAHFSCHGRAYLQSPLKSELKMALGESITLEDLIRFRAKGLRLVSLSACESGMIGVTLPDEILSLPSGLLEAKAAGVVSSLWSVDEESTMILMIRFYELWKQERWMNPAKALCNAQRWVRDSYPNFAHPFYWSAFTYVGA